MVGWERILSVKLSGYRALTINPLSPKIHIQILQTDTGGGGGGRAGGGRIGLIFAGNVPLTSRNPYPIIVYSVAIL